jgi:hypothetical protein
MVEHMFKATKTTMIAGAAVVALIGIGGGVAFAGSSGSPTPNTLTAATTSTTPAGGTNTPAKHKHRGPLARAEHGSVTVRTKTGTEVIDLQRGQVTAVSPTSISVRSQDGFSATYVVTSTTKVRKTGQPSAIGNVADGDNVVIEAVHSGTTDTARHIGDHGTPKQPTTTH